SCFGEGGRTGRKGTVRVSRGDQPWPIPLSLGLSYLRFVFASTSFPCHNLYGCGYVADRGAPAVARPDKSAGKPVFLRGSSQGAHVSSFSAFVPLVSNSDSAEGFLLCPFPLTRAGRLGPVAHHRMDSGKECFEIERLVD